MAFGNPFIPYDDSRYFLERTPKNERKKFYGTHL